MPAQLSMILYISEYKEKTSGEFFIGMATGHTRLEGNSDATQEFNITVFYPLNQEKPCYAPKLEEGQFLSIANSKFAIGPIDNQIDVRNYFILILFKYICY